jgi:hypothetical protein
MRSARWILVAAALGAACDRDSAPPPPPVDMDGDGVPAGIDCGDANAAVHTWVSVFPDTDGDGVGAGTWETSFCTDGSAPAGYSLQGTDCAPEDPAAWRSVEPQFADRDGDGVTIAEQASLCAGATLPEPYREVANGNDCDDSDPALARWVVLYPDRDGDGVGTRPRTISCIGASLPAGFALTGYDVDDSDPTIASGPPTDPVLDLVLE